MVAAATARSDDYVVRIDADTSRTTRVDVPASVAVDDGIEVAHGALWVSGSEGVARVDLGDVDG